MTKEELITNLRPYIEQYNPSRIYIVGSNRIKVTTDTSDWDVKFILDSKPTKSVISFKNNDTNIDILLSDKKPNNDFWYYADYMLYDDTECIYGTKETQTITTLEAFKKCYSLVINGFDDFVSGNSKIAGNVYLVNLLYYTKELSSDELLKLRNTRDKTLIVNAINKLKLFYEDNN